MIDPPDYVQLMLHGVPIYCQVSDRPIDPYYLKSLQLKAKKRTQLVRSSGTVAADEKLDINTYETFTLSCGVWDYRGSELVFVPYYQWKAIGEMKFGPRKLTYTEPESGNRIEIWYNSVKHITVNNEPQSSMTFTLTQAPHLSQRDPLSAEKMMAQLYINKHAPQLKIQDVRVTHLGPAHEQIVATCLVYRFECNAFQFSQKLAKLRLSPRFPPLGYRRTRSWLTTKFWDAQRRELSNALTETHAIPFEVRFQLSK